MSRSGGGAGRLLLRLIVAAGLAIDAYVHFDLAPQYSGVADSISESTLFRIDAGVAAVTALLVIVVRRWITDLLALLVAAAGIAAVLVYRYIDVGAFGPFPDMYEPVWFTKKTLSAVAEGVALLAAAALVLSARRRRRRVE